jgi:serine/threonine protein kinase
MSKDENNQAFRTGDIIARRYCVERFIGAGGMGTVYDVRDEVLGGMQLALKILHPPLALNKTFVARFLREVELMRRVNHTNVVHSFDVGLVDGAPFYAMEFVPGRTLYEVEREYFYQSTTIAHLLTQLCHGLNAIHSMNIVHRDLKPQNILVTNEGIVKIADFGIARRSTSRLTDPGAILGTPWYVAPELWDNAPASPRTDLYALGVILYECLSGVVPFDSDSPASVMTRHLNETPRRLIDLEPRVPLWLSEIVEKLLQKQPQLRYPSALAVVAEISAPRSASSTGRCADTVVTVETVPTDIAQDGGQTQRVLFLNNPTKEEMARQEEYFRQRAKERRKRLLESLEIEREEEIRDRNERIRVFVWRCAAFTVFAIPFLIALFTVSHLLPAVTPRSEVNLGTTHGTQEMRTIDWLTYLQQLRAPSGKITASLSTGPPTRENVGFFEPSIVVQHLAEALSQDHLSPEPGSRDSSISEPKMFEWLNSTLFSDGKSGRQVPIPLAPAPTSVSLPTSEASASDFPVSARTQAESPVSTPTAVPATVRDLQDLFVGVENLVSDIQFARPEDVQRFNEKATEAELERLYRRTRIIKELRSIDVERTGRGGAAAIITQKERLEIPAIEQALHEASERTEFARVRLSKLLAFASVASSAAPERLQNLISEVFPDGAKEAAERSETELQLRERARDLVALEQARVGAAMINYAQVRERLRQELDLIRASESQNLNVPHPAQSAAPLPALEIRRAALLQELQTVDQQISPIAKAISSADL